MTKLLKPLESMFVSLFLFVNFGKWRMKDMFDAWYAGHESSHTIRKIFREVYADECLQEVDQSSFVTRTDLRRMLQHLGIGKGDRIVDLGCGRGGPGLWIARESGASLTGIDISSVAVEAARQRISDFGLTQEVRFQMGSFERTGLADGSYDGAISVDALFLVQDKSAAIQEAKRILRPSARFVFTSWEGDMPAMVKDHRRLLQDNGFETDLCEEPERWRERQAAVYRRIIAERNTLITEAGKAAARIWIRDAANIKYLDRIRRVLVVARRV